MSGIAKAVKKTFKAATKVVKKVVKSKVFKAVAIAAVVYFGGAALNGIMSGQGAMAGISNAWTQVGSAGSSLMSGNFSQAGSALSQGFTGSNLTTAANTAAATAKAPEMAAELYSAGGAGKATATDIAGSLVSQTAPAATAPTNAGGLLSGAWNGLGEAGKAAAITSGVNIGGQMLQGHAAEKQSEDIRKRRTYWGVDGEGQGDASSQQMGGLLQLAQTTPMSSFKPGNAPWNAQPQSQYVPQAQQQPQTLDELIKMMG